MFSLAGNVRRHWLRRPHGSQRLLLWMGSVSSLLLLIAIYQFSSLPKSEHLSSVAIVEDQPLPSNQDNHVENPALPSFLLAAQRDNISEFDDSTESITFGKYKRTDLVIAIVSCGLNRADQTVTALKSALIFTKRKLHFVIMADNSSAKHINDAILHNWPLTALTNISFEIHPVRFPRNGSYWKKLFKECASQRLFLPTLLTHIDAAIYIDNDVLFLSPPEELWQYFDQMNTEQVAAMAPEHEDYSAGWYNRFAKHPFVKPLGVNSGVMLMNLTRMRAFNWDQYLQPVLDEYKLEIVWGDQDIINIIFHFHREKLLIFPCEWNYRPDHCIYTQVCKSIYKEGVKIIHGNRDAFASDKLPAFKRIFLAIRNYQFQPDKSQHLADPMRIALEQTINTNCGKHYKYLMKAVSQSV